MDLDLGLGFWTGLGLDNKIKQNEDIKEKIPELKYPTTDKIKAIFNIFRISSILMQQVTNV